MIPGTTRRIGLTAGLPNCDELVLVGVRGLFNNLSLKESFDIVRKLFSKEDKLIIDSESGLAGSDILVLLLSNKLLLTLLLLLMFCSEFILKFTGFSMLTGLVEASREVIPFPFGVVGCKYQN